MSPSTPDSALVTAASAGSLNGSAVNTAGSESTEVGAGLNGVDQLRQVPWSPTVVNAGRNEQGSASTVSKPEAMSMHDIPAVLDALYVGLNNQLGSAELIL
jgi:hypothetical protein